MIPRLLAEGSLTGLIPQAEHRLRGSKARRENLPAGTNSDGTSLANFSEARIVRPNSPVSFSLCAARFTVGPMQVKSNRCSLHKGPLKWARLFTELDAPLVREIVYTPPGEQP
jgi:hypothetical protein